MTLPADKRVKVAEACTGLMYSIHEDEEFGSLILRGPVYPGAEVDLMDEWDPSGDDFKALVQKVAQIIYDMPRDTAHDVDIRRDRFAQLGIYIAKNDVDEIENLCYELMSGEVG